jgi:Bacterial Ig domain
MWLGITSSAALLFFTVSAFADSCIFSAAPPFQLRSDAVDWTMQIASGTSCTRGLKLGPITVSDVKLIASPQSGQVVIKGPAFSYTAKPDFQGQDDFTLQVSGTMVRIPGVSDIQVTISVVAK